MKLDPWTILGAHRGASAAQIRSAWRHQVSRWHPDRNPDPDATVRLQSINDAYASIVHGRPMPDLAPPPPSANPVLAGLSGTVYGRACPPATAADAAGIRVQLDIPARQQRLDTPVTLAIPLSPDFTTLVTIVHPARFADGAVILFPASGLTDDGRVTDLLATMHIATPELRAANTVDPATCPVD